MIVMKKVLLTSVLSAATLFAYCQASLDSLKPKAGERTLTLGIINNSAFFVFKKYCTPTMACRFGFAGNYAFSKTEGSNGPNSYFDQNGVLTTYYDRYKNSSSNVALNVFFGAQKSFGNFKNFEPYMGADIVLGNALRRNSQETIYDANPNNNVANRKTETKELFNPSFAFMPLVGFNYYIAERFALGVEYRVPVVNVSLQGKSEVKTTVRYATGNTIESTPPEGNKGVLVSGNFQGTAFITATLFLK